MATTPIVAPPIVFNLRGYNTQISYSNSILGSQLTYKNSQEELIFGTDDLTIEQTQIGQIVTVSLTKNPAAEILETLTLLVPVVNLSPTLPKCEVLTTAIFSQVLRTKGQVQTYMTICLAGTAEQDQGTF